MAVVKDLIVLGNVNTTGTISENGVTLEEKYGNKINTIQVNGSTLTITNKTVNVPLANGSNVGVVKTTSTTASTDGLIPTPIINGVPYYRESPAGTDELQKVSSTTETFYISGITNSPNGSAVVGVASTLAFIAGGNKLIIPNISVGTGTISNITTSTFNGVSVPANPKFTDTIYTHPATSGSNTTSTTTSKTFDVIDSITKDTSGHVSKFNTKTVTVPDTIIPTLSLSTHGSGNAITTISVNGHTIDVSFNKTFLTSETTLSTNSAAGSGSTALTSISVNGHTITTYTSSFATSNDRDPGYGKITPANNNVTTSLSGNTTLVTASTYNENIKFNATNKWLTISGSNSNTAGSDEIKFAHSWSGVTTGSYGPSENKSPGYDGTFSVPYLTVDEAGHITGASTKTITLPSNENTDEKVKLQLGSENAFYSVLSTPNPILPTDNALTTISYYLYALKVNPNKFSILIGSGLNDYSCEIGQSSNIMGYSVSYGKFSANGPGAHAEGYAYDYSIISSDSSGAHAEGHSLNNSSIIADGWGAHAEGCAGMGSTIKANGLGAHAEGYAYTYGNFSASGNGSHIEGYAIGNSSIITLAHGAHAEGYVCLNSSIGASDIGSHAEGCAYDHSSIIAFGEGAHAEGHAIENSLIIASGHGAHAEGFALSGTIDASGNGAHAEGINTITKNDSEHAEGKHNKSHFSTTSYGDAGNTLHSIGIGLTSSEETRMNAVEVMQNGDVYVYGVASWDGKTINNASTLLQAIANAGGGGTGTDTHLIVSSTSSKFYVSGITNTPNGTAVYGVASTNCYVTNGQLFALSYESKTAANDTSSCIMQYDRVEDCMKFTFN